MGVGQGMILASLLAAMVESAGAQAAADARPAPRLTLLTEYAPPSSTPENASGSGKVTGSASDKVREVMARTGIAYTLDVQPWRRAYTAALERPGTCVFSATRLPEREHLFKWIGPIDSGEWVLLGRADRRYAVRTLDDARSLRIGTYNGDARDAYLRERGFNVDAVQNDLLNPEKLLLGRIDLWAAGLRRVNVFLQQHGWAGRIVPVLVFKKVDVYLACNRALPDALAARMNDAIGTMQRDGTMKKIERKYDSATGIKPARAQ